MYQYQCILLIQMNPARASRLRQQVACLRTRRAQLETRLLRRRRMLRASLVERYLGTTAKKRKTPAYYLSGLYQGKTVLRYVRKEDWSRVLPQARAWSEYYHLAAQWVKLGEELEAVWRELGQAQADEVSWDERS